MYFYSTYWHGLKTSTYFRIHYFLKNMPSCIFLVNYKTIYFCIGYIIRKHGRSKRYVLKIIDLCDNKSYSFIIKEVRNIGINPQGRLLCHRTEHAWLFSLSWFNMFLPSLLLTVVCYFYSYNLQVNVTFKGAIKTNNYFVDKNFVLISRNRE